MRLKRFPLERPPVTTQLACFAIVILTLGCVASDDPNRELTDKAALLSHGTLAPVELSGRQLVADTMLGTPARVRILSDSLLLVVDALPPFFHLINRGDGRLLSSFGRKGGGPGEFNSAVDIALVSGQGSRFWAYDVERKFMTLVDIDVAPGPDSRIIELRRIGYYHAPLFADDSTLIVQSNSDSSAVAVYDLTSGDVQLIGKGMQFSPPSGLQMSPTASRQLNSEVRMCAGPRGRYARFHRLSGRFELLDSNGVVRAAKVPYAFEPTFENSPDHGLTVYIGNRDQRASYGECVATERYVFALFAGRRWGSLSREEQNEFRNASFLHVFSWDGDYLAAAKFEEPIVGMDIDTLTGQLYGVRFRPEPSLVLFDLAPLLVQLR